MDINSLTNMRVTNKSLNREKRREKILSLMNYYIDTDNIVYVDSI